MVKKSMTEVVATIVAELTPFDSDERQRVVRASMVLLGETQTHVGSKDPSAESPNGDDGKEAGEDLPLRARTWRKQNQLSREQIDQVFHIDGESVEIIAAQIPGKGNREKVRNAYVLLGIARLLATGEPKFDDKSARELCEKSGFYDQTNHMKYMKGGNEFTGTKAKGWTLTTPGLKHGAAVVADIIKAI